MSNTTHWRKKQEKNAPKSHPGHPKSTQNGSRDPPWRSPERLGPPRVGYRVSRTLPESAEGEQKTLPGSPWETQNRSRRPPGASPSEKTAHAERLYIEKIDHLVFIPFFTSFFEHFGRKFDEKISVLLHILPSFPTLPKPCILQATLHLDSVFTKPPKS